MEATPESYIGRNHIILLRTIQQLRLRSILKIKWDLDVTNDDVLDRVKVTDIALILIRNRLRWMGYMYVTRMPNKRPVKALVYGEVVKGSGRISRPFLRFKGTLKNILKRVGALHLWEAETVSDRPVGGSLSLLLGQDKQQQQGNENKEKRVRELLCC